MRAAAERRPRRWGWDRGFRGGRRWWRTCGRSRRSRGLRREYG
uniref:Uncharacterized protein n=1 Tax=Arundo donax TaxID=35708 RepID=A0A0A9FBR4_ARUDO